MVFVETSPGGKSRSHTSSQFGCGKAQNDEYLNKEKLFGDLCSSVLMLHTLGLGPTSSSCDDSLNLEKQKSEYKDRKVLEILQVKDAKIQELEQRESVLKQEINDLVKKKIAVDEEYAFLREEFSNLQKKFKDKSQEVKDTKERVQNKEEQNRLVIKNLEEENEKLSIRCADLLNDLEKLRKQETHWRKEKHSTEAKIKAFEDNLIEAKKEIEASQSKYNALSLQLNNKQTELIQKDMDITLVRKELQELQNLYKQNSAHTAQQAELIQQLQVLNMDTQKVLRNQEDVHTAESISYQKLYNELHVCFETTKSSEAMLRQSVVNLQDQLFQKEQENAKLKEELQESQRAHYTLPQESDSDHSAQASQQPSLSSLETLMVSQKSEIEYLQKKLEVANAKLSEDRTTNKGFSEKSTMSSAEGMHKEPPVKRSRSLSPKNSITDSEELRKLRKAERKIENLEKALQLKSQENDELRDAHEKRKERLQMLQTNYRAVKEQLKQWEEGSGMDEIRKMKRADPQQLRQEDSDAVWNELAYFKRENQELMIQKLNLQEELDELKVHISVDKATIQELNRFVAEKREEQLFRYGEDDGVKKSTTEKNEKEMLEQTLQKVIELENRLKSFEKRSRKLREGNKKLIQENDCLKSLLQQQQEDADTREKELEQLLKESKDVEKDKTELQVKISELEREVTSLRRQVAEANAMRNENEELMNPTEKLHHSADKVKPEMAIMDVRSGHYDCKTTTTKVKFKAAKKKCSVGRHHTVLNHSIKVMSNVFEDPSKDGWQDVSESSSDSETQTSQSLGTITVETTQKISPIEDGRDQKETDQIKDRQIQGKEIVQAHSSMDCKTTKNTKKPASQKKSGNMQKNPYTTIPTRVTREKYRGIIAQKSSSNLILLRERIISLQQQNTILQNAKKTAELSVREYKEVNEKLLHQQQVSDQRFQTSRQTIKKLNSDLAGLRKEKEDLLKKLESSSEITSLAEEISRVTVPRIQVTSLGPSRSMDMEMKQLQCKLKNATNELTKQSSNVKSLKFELLAKEEHIKEIHEKMSRMERDITMKRHLIEDLKFRQKVNSESNESFNEMLENLEKKVKTLTEECSNKKISIDSLKQRLNVAVKEKSQYEQMYQRTKEELEKKELKLTILASKINETETAMAEIETAASKQLQGLALQSEQVLEGAQKKLLIANETVEEFRIFVKGLVKELQKEVHVIRRQIRELKKMQKNRVACKTSTHRAQTLAASILNISRSDLEDILDTEDEEEIEKTKMDAENDKEWLLYIQKLLEGQKVSEKVGGAEGTKLDDDFKEMERKVDVTSRAVMEIMTKTIEYLQPNPASRAKLSMINTMSKIRGQEKGPGYPQAEALLAEAMLKFGRELGDDCNFGPALGEVGEAMRELSEVKDSLDMEVKQNFIDPLQNLHDKDLREIQHHLKKLEGRRLDFDYKKKRQGKIPDEELRQALEKFDESKEIAESSMFNLLEMDIEQVSQLSALVQAQLEYHKQAVQILQQVTVRLEERIRQASSQPRREYQPKPRMSLEFPTGDSSQPNGGLSHTGTPKPAGAPMDQPCCRALYDFEPENEGELGFKEGDIITLTNQIDENWYEGMLHGQSGFFPINYVEILVALPH
ncbi:centlein isoform X5 [Lepus europaeus]|uniref:centlein isoform X5 n=1 Tax=Lepus europaeus TaxID=9983 RepID=UPI002B4895BA|nr:centlein isoform X5 [Lepus europaeus]